MNLHLQIEELLRVPASIHVPTHVTDLLGSYSDKGDPAKRLDLTLFAEPYYGDPDKKCSLVFCTHNPGASDSASKGSPSPFLSRIDNPLSKARAGNYLDISATNSFPNCKTNTWVNKLNDDIIQFFQGSASFTKRAFIRDLVPYHSNSFGTINMRTCTKYLYGYFFNQVIEAAMNSELYDLLNNGQGKPMVVMFARGGAWIDKLNGLDSVGWKRIGRVCSNCYIYKAIPEDWKKLKDFDLKNYPGSIFNHEIYIIAFTQVLRGGPIGIYSKKRNIPTRYFKLSDCLEDSSSQRNLFEHLIELARSGRCCY